MSNFNQLVIWRSTVVGKENVSDFENWLKEEGFNVKYAEEVETLPDIVGDIAVEGTGGRNDLFFYIHDKDIPKFAMWRLQHSMSWWEDVLGNGDGCLYPTEILEKYPKTW